jgi:hypothetical protein
MKTRIIKLLLFGVSIFYSCQKEEEVKPATNPRFSVAFIQEIDIEGVQFAANVIDYGSDEILEYGFVYSQAITPRVGKDEVVRQFGKPSEFFELKGVHSMKVGETYRVAAFMKTSRGIVYSKVVNFVSKGSLGFVISEIESKGSVYFGDTIEVKGSNFSNILGNYRVTLQGMPGRVFGVSEKGFKFALPTLFPFGEKQVTQGLYDFEISVAGKVLELEYPLNFREASFQIDPNQTINYEDIVEIEGSYLTSETIEVKYIAENGNEYLLPIVDFSTSMIKFKPVAKFLNPNPEIQVTVRGKKYSILNAFKLKAPEIDPEQVFTQKVFSGFRVSGKNLNIHYPEWNSLSFAKSDLNYVITSVSPTTLSFELLDGESGYFPRENEIYFNNAGQNSTNYVKVRFTDPVLPFMRADQVFKEQVGVGGGVSMGDYGYFFRVKSIYKFTPSTRKMEFVAGIQTPELLANIFTLKSPNGKIYSGGHAENVFFNQSSPEIFEFDPSNNTLVKLPKIPSDVIQPFSVYATDKYLYYEEGFKITPAEGYVEVNERWRFDFALRIWEKLDGQIEIKDYSYDFKTFWYNGKLYKIGIDNELGGFNVLKEFDPIQDLWITKVILSYNFQLYTEVIPIIGNEAFLASFNLIIKLNLDTFQESIVKNIEQYSEGFSPYQIMPIDGKLYSTNGYRIQEIDPAYFTY